MLLGKDRMKHISVEDFRAHVSHMHADRDKWFETEYNVSVYYETMYYNINIQYIMWSLVCSEDNTTGS